MFEDDQYNSNHYHYQYMFHSSLQGTVYSVCLLPSIADVVPRHGSLGGNTIVTITGSGFSLDAGELEVYVGGLPCKVLSSDTTWIRCATASQPADTAGYQEVVNTLENDPSAAVTLLNSSRKSGSAGWWCKLWNREDRSNGDVGDESAVEMQFGYRQPFYFTLEKLYGSGWVNSLGFDTTSREYSMDSGSVFTAPYSARYTFYISSDDSAMLYGSFDGININESLLCSSTYTASFGFYEESSQISDTIELTKGQEYFLRSRLVNVGGPDFVLVAVKISPLYDCEGLLVADVSAECPSAGSSNLSQAELHNAQERNFPAELIRHHGVKEMQEIQLSLDLEKEIQVVNITGASTAEFYLYVQGWEPTTLLTMSSSAADIRSALRTAAYSIAGKDRETASFTVWKEDHGSFMEIYVQFDEDNQTPYTTLFPYAVSLIGVDPAINVIRQQEHSLFPTDSFELLYEDKTARIDWDSSVDAVESILEESFAINVEVSRTGQKLSGYHWLVTFISPVEDVSQIVVDTAGIGGIASSGRVDTLVNGSTTELFFEPLPAWMVAVPVEWATAGAVKSGVEVFRAMPSGEQVKAVCDETEPGGGDFLSTVKGTEAACAHAYSSNVTALVTDTTVLSIVDSNTVEIGILGTGFLIGGVDVTVKVEIGGEMCNVTMRSDTEVTCVVASVPWGERQLSLNIEGYGDAIFKTDSNLTFTQAINSIYPLSGSVTGGQVLTIEGRGFRRHASIEMGSGACDITFYSSSRIECITPSAVAESMMSNATNMTSFEAWTSITIDGQLASDDYLYNNATTPLVDSIFPIDVSTATTQTVEIVGQNFAEGTTVMIDDLSCIVQELFTDLIKCLLVRSSPRQKAKVDVLILVPAVGYASEASSLTTLPSVYVGFDVQMIGPMTASRMGGIPLSVHGFGFETDHLHKHTVQLTKVGRVPGVFEDLLVGLNLYEGVVPGTLECSVVDVSFEMIHCIIPEFENAQLEGEYSIAVTLNDLTANCVQGDTDCFLQLSNSSTPEILSSSQTLVAEATAGEVDITLIGDDVFGEALAISNNIHVEIGGHICAVQSTRAMNNTIVVRAPTLAAGTWELSVLVHSMGYAVMNSAAMHITLGAEILSVSLSATSGSVGGGTLAVVTGYGFNSHCAYNEFNVSFSHDPTVQVPVNSLVIVNCSTTELSLRLPSVLATLDGVWIPLTTSDLTLRSADQVIASYPMMFDYMPQETPLLEALSPSAAGGSDVVISASILTTPPTTFSADSLVVVFIGNVLCPLKTKAVSSTASGLDVNLTCTMPALAGDTDYDVEVILGTVGAVVSNNAITLPVIKSAMSVDVLSPAVATSSVRGGNFLTVTGEGLSHFTHVDVCGESCPLITSQLSSTSLACHLPARQTVSATDYFNSIGLETDDIIDLDGALFNSGGSSVAELEDGDYATSFTHNSISCHIGVAIPDGFKATPYRLRFYPTLQTAADFGSMTYEGSKDGGSSYEELGSLSSAQEGWNFFTASEVKQKEWFTHFRLRNSDASVNSKCNIAEIRFLGTQAATSDTCDVTVMSMTAKASFVPTVIGTVSYVAEALTPLITAITPDNGTALGDTLVTLSGMNLLGSSEPSTAPYVYLRGVLCTVNSFSDTTIECVTGERDFNAMADLAVEEDEHSGHRLLSSDSAHFFVHDDTVAVQVFVVGVGEAVVDDNVQFMYIDKWSALTTWRDQEPPIDGDMVWIPKGQVILLDMSSPVLLVLLVEGELYFDQTKDINLDAHYILINGGHFEVGTDDDPYLHQAVITLHGSRRHSIELPHIGSKVLAVGAEGMQHSHGGGHGGAHHTASEKGVMKIFGQPRLRTWTKIRDTAPKGQDFIVTSEPVDFQSGDVLIITGSEIGSQPWEVVALGMSGEDTVFFTPPLPDTRRSEVRVIEGRTVDLRCEVALITRNIVIQGDENSEGEMFGVHTIAIGTDVVYQIQNVEITKCGQAFNVGRYCTHTHHGGMFEGNFVKANSIHHSFQRAVTTHDALHWEVRDNVAFNVKGHTYFVEDGNEFYNTFSGNLGILTRFSSALLKSDRKPAVFWTSNPNNFWYDNVAAHSQKFGWWFELVSRAPSGTINGVCGQGEALGAFQNNTVKVNAALGLRIYPNWTPHEDPCDKSSPPAPQYLRELTSYRNGGQGLFAKQHGDLHHVDYTSLENRGMDIDIFKYTSVLYTDDPVISNAILVGALEPNDDLNKGRVALWAPQSEFFYIRNVTFVNFGKTALMTGCNKCNSGEFMENGGFTTRFEGLKFVRSTVRTVWSPHYKQIFWDLDGTLAGHANSYVVKWYDFNAWTPLCSRLDTTMYDDSMLCVNTTVRRLEVDYAEPNVLDFTDLRLYAGDTDLSAEVNFLPKVKYGWVAPVVTGEFYRLEWTDSQSSATEFHARLGCEEYLEETFIKHDRNETVGIRFTPFAYDYDPYSFTVYYDGSWRVTNNETAVTLADPMASASLTKTELSNNTLNVVLTTAAADLSLSEPFAVRIKSQLCPPQGCPVPPLPQIPKNSSLWSDPASWPSGEVPVENEEVVIEGNMWIQMDISPPRLRSLQVDGKLTFLSEQDIDLVLESNSFLVYGFMEATGPFNTPFEGNLDIVLSGTKQNSLPLVVGEGIFAGAKVFAVLGELTLLGQPVAENWVRLGGTAAAGDTRAVLQYADNGHAWAAGDDVVFSPTGYFDQAGDLWSKDSVEYRTISGVQQLSNNQVEITFNPALSQTHFCETMEGETFCGTVALLTRNIMLSSRDSEDPLDMSNYGFGGHMLVTDRMTDWHGTPRLFSGLVNIEGVYFKHFGKINSANYGVTFEYGHSHGVNLIQNTSFVSNYNFVVHATATSGLIVRNTVAVDVSGGGIFIDSTCSSVRIDSNVMIGIHQLTSVLASTYPWTRPVAGITVFSDSALSVQGNVVAGSVDQGFAIIAGLFVSSLHWCEVTRGEAFVYDTHLISGGVFTGNEAVGGKYGLAVVTAAGQNSASDCAVVHDFVAWRNAHVGIGAVAATVNIMLVEVVVAENHIGVLIDYVKFSPEAVSGVLASIVIGSLHSDGFSDSAGSAWDRHCHVFTGGDPHSLSSACSSVINSYYHRAGIVVSQWTSRGKTCGVDNGWDQCQPYDTPERLCALPLDKRYAVPVGMQYSEMHIHDTTFSGFRTDVASSRIATAMAVNPSQIDQQPTMLLSGLTWRGSLNEAARFNFPGQDKTCESRTCMGLDMNILHDQDGSLVGTGVSSQVLQGNPGYAAPAPDCQTASHLGTGVTVCPSSGFQQYAALWKDNQNFLIGPIIVSREFPNENRSYASYAPLDDLCAMRFSFSRFPMYIAPQTFHRIESTGTVPQTFYFRWDAPSDTDSAVLEFFIHGTNAVRVFVSDSENGVYDEVTRFSDRMPTFSDPAGSSARNPQARTLTVTVRGGTRRFYKFVVVPVVAISMKLEMDFDTFFQDNFIVNIAALLGISVDRIKVAEVRRGSVIISLTIDPVVLDVGVAADSQEVLQEQVDELSLLGINITQMTEDGSLADGLNTTILTFTLVETVVTADEEPENVGGDHNVTNTTDDHGVVIPLITIAPTFSPPSAQPTLSPSPSRPSVAPSGVPSLSYGPSIMPTITCVFGERAACNHRGICVADSAGDPVCACDDTNHYWTSERCSVYHEGGELLEGNCCVPNTKDYYCSWQGTCDSTGQFCECDDPQHRSPEDRCSQWYQSPPLQPGEVCSPGTVDDYCHWRGTCNGQGTECVCQDPDHYLAAEQCAQFHVSTSAADITSVVAAAAAANDHCPPLINIPTPTPTAPLSSSPSSPSTEPSGTPSRVPVLVPTAAPSITTDTPTEVPHISVSLTASPTATASVCDRAYCNQRGVCTLVSGVATCACYDFYHYWPSEQCSERHDGRELQPGQVCYPDTKDQYCSWLGTCNSDGSACVCDEPTHRLPEEQCQVWHATVPTPAPVLTPTIQDAPSMTPHIAPTKAPSVEVCIAGDRSHCNNRGRCSSTGTACVCDDIYHYWASELCLTYHWGRELNAEHHVCFPETSDYYCNYLGVCAVDGLSCECFDPVHRSPTDNCKAWQEVVNVPTPAPVPLVGGQVCVPGEYEYCNDNGYCLNGGDGCACWDELHYWPSELCVVYHHGPELEEPGDCCLPGDVDYYCSWMGECAPDGESCVCFDLDHYWPSDRCQLYHDGPDSATVVPNTCPAMLSIPDENEQRNNEDNSPSNSVWWQYLLLGLIGGFLLVGLIGYGGYRYYQTHYVYNGNNSSMYSYDSYNSKGTMKSGVEMNFHKAIPTTHDSHINNSNVSDLKLSIMENQEEEDLREVDLSDMAGIYKDAISYTSVNINPKDNKKPVFHVRDDSFASLSVEEESPRIILSGTGGRPNSPKRRPSSSKVSFMSLNPPPSTSTKLQGAVQEVDDQLVATVPSTAVVVAEMSVDEFHLNTDESRI